MTTEPLTRDFPITITVDGRVRVTVVLTLKAGTDVEVKEVRTDPEPPSALSAAGWKRKKSGA